MENKIIIREIVIVALFSLLFSLFLFHRFSIMNDEEYEMIHIGIIMKNAGRRGFKSFKLKNQFSDCIKSILRHKKRKTDLLHFVILTDEGSVHYLKFLLERLISLEKVFFSYDFFDVNYGAFKFTREIRGLLRPYFTSSRARYYADDLFLLAPFFHRLFPFNKLIALDVDLKFKTDIGELYREFNRFSGRNLFGMAPDLSPHYRIVLRHYRRENPGTEIGDPGRFQGLNTGVVLYDLERMRRDNYYESLLDIDSDKIRNLTEKYSFQSHLGDQCFFSLLSLENPDLFYPLNCAYNYQLDVSLGVKPWADIFNSYHYCPLPEEGGVKIYHGNGGSEIPDDDELKIRDFISSQS